MVSDSDKYLTANDMPKGSDIRNPHLRPDVTMEFMDIFIVLSLDPYETYSKAMVKSRLHLISLLLHGDHSTAGSWTPPGVVNIVAANHIRQWLGGDDTFEERWADVASRERADWHSTWKYIDLDRTGREEQRNTPLSGHTARFPPAATVPVPPPPTAHLPPPGATVVDLTEEEGEDDELCLPAGDE